MRIPIARQVTYAAFVALAGVAFMVTTPLRAQERDTVQKKLRLSRSLAALSRSLDDIKWSSVGIYRVEEDLGKRLLEPLKRGSAKDSAELGAALASITPDGWSGDAYNGVLRIARSPRPARDLAKFKEALASLFGIAADDMEDQEIEPVQQIAVRIVNQLNSNPKVYYLVATRDKANPGLIALLGGDEKDGDFILKGQPLAGIDVYNYLQTADSTLYGDLKTAVADRSTSLNNRMNDLRNLADIVIVPTSRVRATYLDEERFPHVLLSISNGRPLRSQDSARLEAANILTGDPTLPQLGSATPASVEYPYEVTVGTDILASFMAYKVTSDTLPVPEADWGVELRNNFDEINYPSIWGGRLTLNAILENIKVGAVLPQIRFGGNTLDSSGIGSNRQKVIGGYGIALSGDFAAPILNNSGLFNFYGSYTFSEANTDKIKLYTPPADVNLNEQGYLIRYAFQGYYSFGFYADADAKHLFRLKIGGTVYGVDAFTRQIDTSATIDTSSGSSAPTHLVKGENFNHGGVSGKIEYMKTGSTIPWGLGVQYFDQSILSNVWIQFAINRRLDLKIEGKYFAPLSPSDRLLTHPWENPNLIVPSVSVKYHFGPQP
ncbi:MAG: hypothetical protein ABIR47_17825 [Candidatus Kapaibacterium sp.]